MSVASKNSFSNPVDVLIVGAGPVGLTLSNLLALRGIKGVCVDKLDEGHSFPRAISLDNDALRIFFQLGFSEKDFNFLHLNEVNFFSSFFGKLLTLNMSGSFDTFPKLISFYQPEIERKLKEKLYSYKNFQLLYKKNLTSYRYKDHYYEVFLEGEKGQTHVINCTYLIGADGAHSLVRRLENLDFEFLKNYEDNWLILDTFKKNKLTSKNKVTFYCDFNKPCPSIPAPGGRHRFEFRLGSGKNIQSQIENGPWENFFNQNKLKENRGEGGLDNNFTIERKAIYQFKACTAKSFQNQGVFLVGDSAHLTPPFAGQGLVSGLKDVLNLGWKLEYSIKGKLSENILKTYTLERKPLVKKVIRLAMIAGYIASPKTRISSFIGQGFLFFISNLPLLKGFIKDFQFKPDNRIKKGFLVRNNLIERSFAGKQFPSVWLREPYNLKKVRSDSLFKGAFCLFCLDLDPQITFCEGTLKRWLDWGGKIVFIKKLKDFKNKKNFKKNNSFYDCKKSIWIDEEEKLSSFAGNSSHLFIVRPDFIIFNSGRGKEPGRGDSFIKESLSFLEKKCD